MSLEYWSPAFAGDDDRREWRETQFRDLTAQVASFALTSRHLKIGGRSEWRAPDAPAALRAK
jgi:hypothetical protein